MAIHHNLADLSAEAIDEYIDLARIGLSMQKPNGGCYGFPSTLLMFCVLDALSNHLGYRAHSFGILNDSPFNSSLSPKQIDRLKVWFRHLLAHNGMIAAGTILSPESNGSAIELANGEPVKIRVFQLFALVEQAWKAFDKKKLKVHKVPPPSMPTQFGASVNVPFGASGAPFQP